MSERTIMEQLKEETWPLHQRAERARLEQDLVKGRLPREVYRDYLGQRFLIHRTLETRLREGRIVEPRLQTAIQDRQFFSSHAADDLRFFGGDAEQATALAATEELLRAIESADMVSLLGFQYVFEGSMNGARYIARALRSAWCLQDGEGTRYLDPFGAEQPEAWQAFKATLNGMEFAPHERESIVAAAKATFSHMIEVEAELYPAGVAG